MLDYSKLVSADGSFRQQVEPSNPTPMRYFCYGAMTGLLLAPFICLSIYAGVAIVGAVEAVARLFDFSGEIRGARSVQGESVLEPLVVLPLRDMPQHARRIDEEADL